MSSYPLAASLLSSSLSLLSSLDSLVTSETGESLGRRRSKADASGLRGLLNNPFT